MAKQQTDQDFLGRGWNFPPTFENQGRSVRMVSADEDIRQSLQILLGTRLGERVMRPAFGWQREALMFEPMSTTFATSLKSEVKNAILFCEPRIILDKVILESTPETEGLIEIRIEYTIRTTNSRSNLVYPFYLGEATDASV